MAPVYDPTRYKIIPLLQNEEQGQLEKAASFYDISSRITEEYKTFPQALVNSVCLKRTFTYDNLGNEVGRTVTIDTWTQTMEDLAASGIVPFMNNFSIQFDGINDYVDITHDAAIDFDRLDAFTLSCWIKTTSVNETYMEKMDGNTGWRLYEVSNRLTLEFRGLSVADRIRVSFTDPDIIMNGNWHFLVATYDGSGNASGVQLYIDSVVPALDIQNDTLTGSPSNVANMSIGSRTGGGDYFAGNVDEVAIWDTVLTINEVATIYNGGSPIDLSEDIGNYTSSASLNAWWRMGDSDTFPTLLDNEGTADGTMTNMVSGDIESEVP